MCEIVNKSAADCSISPKFYAGFGHMSLEVLENFKIKGLKVKVRQRRPWKSCELHIASELLQGFKQTLTQILTVVGKRTDYFFKVTTAKVTVTSKRLQVEALAYRLQLDASL